MSNLDLTEAVDAAERAAPTEASTPLPGLRPCPVCGADGWSYCRDRRGEPIPLDKSHIDRTKETP